MPDNQDLFGLDGEKKIIDSGIREVFTPHKPVSSVNLFFGRQAEVGQLVQQINTPGQHSLIYGDRGVGKSSLANISYKLILSRLALGKSFDKKCGKDDTFRSIFVKIIKHFGRGLEPSSIEVSTENSGELGGDVKLIRGVKSSSSNRKEIFDGNVFSYTPSDVADLLKNKSGVFLIDEVDAVTRKSDKRKIAELIKMLSDYGSKFKIILVGIAETGDELTGAHPSVERCLKETKVLKMSDEEIQEIVEGGADRLDLTFQEDVIDEIVNLSTGYPHFTHLLCLRAGEQTIAGGAETVTLNDLWKARYLAVSDAEGRLTKAYKGAVRSYGTDMYHKVLLAASAIHKTDFTAEEWRDSIKRVTGEPISQNSLNNYLKRLATEGGLTVIRRVAKGVYRFNDPRMSSFVRIVDGTADHP